MRRLTGAVFVSVDGVMQAPGGPQEDPRSGFRLGGWTQPFWAENMGPFEKIIELGYIAGHDSRIEIPAIFVDRQRQRRNEPCSISQSDPRHQPVGAFSE